MSAVAAALAVAATLLVGAALRPLAVRPLGAHPAPRRRRDRRSVDAVLPEAIELVVLAVRAGHLPAAAVRAALVHMPTEVVPAFAEVVERVDRGARFADALPALVERIGPQAATVADSLAAADRYGLPLAPVLERIADEARRQRRRAHEARARQLPVRLALPLALCTLPAFVLLAITPLLLAALSSLHT